MAGNPGKPYYRMPESASALCKIVSLTAAKTSLIFDVSVACVRLLLALAAGHTRKLREEWTH